MENLQGKKIKNAERENIFGVEKFDAKKNWNHTDPIQPITFDSTNVGSIHDSANIRAIEKYWHHWYILQYPLPNYFCMGMQVILHQHRMTHQQKA